MALFGRNRRLAIMQGLTWYKKECYMSCLSNQRYIIHFLAKFIRIKRDNSKSQCCDHRIRRPYRSRQMLPPLRPWKFFKRLNAQYRTGKDINYNNLGTGTYILSLLLLYKIVCFETPISNQYPQKALKNMAQDLRLEFYRLRMVLISLETSYFPLIEKLYRSTYNIFDIKSFP